MRCEEHGWHLPYERLNEMGERMKETTNHLVMIHGLLGSIGYFSPTRYLEGTVVHTPDLMGYGKQPILQGATPLTLHNQADFIADYIKTRIGAPCWVLGHSVGGAIAMLVAHAAPELVSGVVSVEGNFTLNDAFWCRKIAPMPEEAWAAEYRQMQADPAAWLQRGEIDATPERLDWARAILHNQPASTVQAMARAVVAETAPPSFLDSIRSVVERGTPIHLLAGERSASGWDVPPWVRTAASSDVALSETGHMMMLETPEAFCSVVSAMIERTLSTYQKGSSRRSNFSG